jgi:uncharacterized protein Usg
MEWTRLDPMHSARGFEAAIRRDARLVTVLILYHLPDHRSLLNEFVWQTQDVAPRYPRVGAFLDHWRREIEAVIREVLVGHAEPLQPARIRAAQHHFRWH